MTIAEELRLMADRLSPAWAPEKDTLTRLASQLEDVAAEIRGWSKPGTMTAFGQAVEAVSGQIASS